MKTSQIFSLEEWVHQKKGWIMSSNSTLKDIRARAETELGFKCSTDAIKSCMARHEIAVRRSKTEAEKQVMKEQIEELTELVVDLVAHGNLPPGILMKFRERGRNLNSRVMGALNRQTPATVAD